MEQALCRLRGRLFLFDHRYSEAFDADAPGLRLFFREYRGADARTKTLGRSRRS